MVRNFDIYIRPAETPTASFTLVSGTNTLDGWDRIERAKKGVKVTVEPDVTDELSDGTPEVAGEKVTVELGTFRAEKEHYDYLRASFHNVVSDLLLYDPYSDTFLMAVWGVRLAVVPVAEGGSQTILNINGGRKFGSAAAIDAIVTIAANQPASLLTGIVYGVGGSTPISGATVSVTGGAHTYTDTTDADGAYLIKAYAPATYIFTVTKSGRTFPTGQTVQAVENLEVRKNFTALT